MMGLLITIVPCRTWNNGRTLDQITVCLTKWSENLCGQKSSEALLKIIWSTFTFVNMIASAGVVCECRVLLACFISGWGADSSFEADTAYKCTRNWYKIITKNCAINLLQNVWVWVYNVGTRAQETRWQHGSLRFFDYWAFINIITLLTSS